MEGRRRQTSPHSSAPRYRTNHGSQRTGGDAYRKDHRQTAEPEYRNAAMRSRRNMYAIARRRQAKNLLCGVFCVVIALIITVVLARSYWSSEPVEVSASPEIPAVSSQEAESTAEPMPIETEYVQLSDWQLVLVNEDVALPEDYMMTPRLYGDVQVHSRMYPQLCALMEAAYAEDLSLWVASGYRSVETQENILEKAVQSRMRDGYSEEDAYADARLTIQAPGHSEHHTGLAVDFNYVTADFRDTEEYAWLQEHAAEYGFVERYPADKEEITGIDYEPWHYRYVGLAHAEAMKALGMCLEEYVQYCKEQG